MAGIIRSITAIFVSISSFFVPTHSDLPITPESPHYVDTLQLRQAAVDARKIRNTPSKLFQSTSDKNAPQKNNLLPSKTNSFAAKYIGSEFANKESLGTSTGTVVGYLWESKEGPRFASLRLPAWGLLKEEFADRQYEIYLWQGDKFVFYQKARTVVDEIKFPEGGVQQFKVLGIDPKLGVCGSDRNVTWGITFSESGLFKGSRTPITDDIPNPDCTKKYNDAFKSNP